MKKPLALLLALTLTLALTACGSGGADPSGSVSTGGNSLLLGVFEPTTTDGTREALGIIGVSPEEQDSIIQTIHRYQRSE